MQKDDQQDQHEKELENKLLVKKKINRIEEVLQEGHMFQQQTPKCGFFLKKSVKEKNGNDEHETRPNVKPLKNVKAKTKSFFFIKTTKTKLEPNPIYVK